MPARIGKKPLKQPAITRLDVEKLKRADELSQAQSIKRSTLIRLALPEYFVKAELPVA